MSLTSDRIHDLLPAIVREHDVARGEPLRALLEVLGREGRVVEDDLARLYDNLFIETCDEWVVPYLGDLLGVQGLNDTGAGQISQRARVANTLAYRRRKGTASMLEQLAHDATGWHARVVEFFELLATTQWLNHVRLHSLHTPDLRRGDALERLGGPFEEARHFVDVRRIAPGRGRYGIPNVGIFLWRLDAGWLAERTARAVDAAGAARGRFTFHPLGIDAPLFNRAQAETSIETLAAERNVPAALRRRPLHEELEARRRALVDGRAVDAVWFDRHPVLEVAYRLQAGAPLVRVPPEEMLVADLSEPAPPAVVPPSVWLRPPQTLDYVRASDGTTVARPIALAVDPVRGRIAFPAGVRPVEVRVSMAHAFPGDVGGGAYDRRATVAQFPLDAVTWQAAVGRDLVADAGSRLFTRVEDAIADWNLQPAGTTGILALIDNGTYDAGGTALQVAEQSRLLIVSADWPEIPAPGGGTMRAAGRIMPTARWAHLVGGIDVRSAADSELWLDGLLLEGDLRLVGAGGARLERLRVAHTTIVPGRGALVVNARHRALRVELFRSITGPVDAAAGARSLCIEQSAVDGAVTAPEVPAEVRGSTITGAMQARELEASNAIFAGPVVVERRQVGCVRFSYLAPGSLTPRRHRCQPDLALAAAATAAEENEIRARLLPDFTGESHGSPAYLQLARAAPAEIRTGADDGAEMGVWWFLRQPQREANLLASLDEYLRLGLEAGPIFVT